MGNTVLSSTRYLIDTATFVDIDSEALEKLADTLGAGELVIPKWDVPVYVGEAMEDVIDFVFLENSINFAFTNFTTGEKYCTEYLGTNWTGSYGMLAALKKAIDNGVQLLDGAYLRDITFETMRSIFTESIPMLQERFDIFREVGKVLCDKYGGHFHNLYAAANGRLFNNGKGLVELLTSDFPSFDDSGVIDCHLVRFDKRAQLAPAVLQGKYQETPLFEDIDKLTAFADYVLPKGLRAHGVLVYTPELADAVDKGVLIPAWSREEMEIRAATIHAADRIMRRINSTREEPITILHLDYALWSTSRKTPGRHHLTRTISY